MHFKRQACLFLLASLTLFASLAYRLHPTIGGSRPPGISIADGGEPPPPPFPPKPSLTVTPA
jgi:hypothetical protein